jgi:hypothetical protein
MRNRKSDVGNVIQGMMAASKMRLDPETPFAMVVDVTGSCFSERIGAGIEMSRSSTD